MKHDESSKRGHKRSSGASIWRIIGGAALVLVAVGVITNLSDIQRYLKIRSM